MYKNTCNKQKRLRKIMLRKVNPMLTVSQIDALISRSIIGERNFDLVIENSQSPMVDLHVIFGMGAKSTIRTYRFYQSTIDNVPRNIVVETNVSQDNEATVVRASGKICREEYDIFLTLEEMGIISDENFYWNRTFQNFEDAQKYLELCQSAPQSMSEEYKMTF